MSSLIRESSKVNINDFEKKFYFNFSSSSINKNSIEESSMDKKFYQFRKLCQSLENIENTLGQLNERNLKYKNKFSEENIFYSNIKSESCDYIRERNPLYSSSMKSVKFKDINRLSPISRSNNENLIREINELKSKINEIRESNSCINITKNQLQNQINNLQDNISKSLKESGTITNSFEKIDNQFFEINKILNDLNESKALLKKTRNRQHGDINSNYKIDQPVSFTIQLVDNEYEPEFKSIFSELRQVRCENSDPKLTNIEIKKEKDEFLKRMSSSCLFNSVPIYSNDEIMKENLDILSKENLSLKSELDQIKQFNKSELAKIRDEFGILKDSHLNEIKLKTKTNRDLQSEIFFLKSKLKKEEINKEEIKTNFKKEMDSAKLRFEVELNTQNTLMQSKYNDLLNEMENLKKTINQLRIENSNLIDLVNKDKSKSKEFYSEKCVSTTTTMSQNFNKTSKLVDSLNEFCESTISNFNLGGKNNLLKVNKEPLHSSTVIYDTGKHSRNIPVRYITSYNLSPSKKIVQANYV